MPESTLEKKIINKLSAEDIVIVVSIVMTLLLAPLLTILWFFDKPILVPPPIISIFLGIAVSALLYRFLGGVQDASFTVGALKVTGTAAILIAVSVWANDELEEYIPSVHGTSFDITRHSIPDSDTWLAVNKETGNPITLEFPKFNQKHDPPSLEELNLMRKGRDINLILENGDIFAYLKNGGDRVLGQIPKNEINKIGFYGDEKIQLIPYRVVTLGASQKEDITANLPFVIETRGFNDNYTRFALIPKSGGDEIHEGAILLRGADVVEYQNHHYLISVVQVNHDPEDAEPYAKIYIAEIQVNRI